VPPPAGEWVPGTQEPWQRPEPVPFGYGGGPTAPVRVAPGAPWSPPPAPPVAGPPAPPPARTHRWGLGAFVVVQAVFLGTSLLLGFTLLGSGPPTVGELLAGLALPTVLAAATALLITRVRGNGPLVDLGLGWSWRDVGLGLAFGVGGLALTIPASVLYGVLVGFDQATAAVGEIFGGLRAGPLAAVGVLMVVALLAPLCEEIVFRGLLWGAVERLGVRPWVPLVVTTLLFALAHFEFTRTPLLLVVALPIAFARLYTGRLLASIVAHQVNNLLPAVMLMLGLLGVMPLAA
jgi:membrane protease YdiL (CAAX protease family)